MMHIEYQQATPNDIPMIYAQCQKIIYDYEDPTLINDEILQWIRRKIENKINEYQTIYLNGQKVGYFHFAKNASGMFELDDLYILAPFQNQGIGSAVITSCLAKVQEPIMLYVFIKNQRAIALYQRHGFEIVKMVGHSRYIMQRN